LSVDATSATLTIASPPDHERVDFAQQKSSPGLTYANHVLPDNAFGGDASAACTNCAPNFFVKPATLAWAGFDAHYAGTFYPDNSVNVAPYDITSSANLLLQSPCALTWEQISALSGGALGFAQVGGEMVLHEGGSVVTVPASFRMCDGLSVSYKIDVYVNLSNLFDYGVRNYTASAPAALCGAA